jgi:hypothetical protein
MIHRRAAVVIGVLCAAMELTSLAQSTAVTPTEFIAFRVDDTHVIAVVKILDNAVKPQANREISPEPMARYGFPYFEAPPEFGAHVPTALRSARWLIHAAPGHAFDATVGRVVGGTANCSTAVGLHLTVTSAHAQQFARLPARYFVAEAAAPPRANEGPPVTVRPVPAPVLTEAQKSRLESVLNDLMTRELPKIRSEAAPDIERMATSDVNYHRSWAAKIQRVDRRLSEGAVKLTYDIQAFQLDPSGMPTYFVRAEWLAGRDQAFAAAVWLRGDRFEIVEANTRPASWLRMFEFQGEIGREQLGLVLNVLDRDRDGWGEIVFAFGGYESLGIGVEEWSPTGFMSSGIDYSFGC